ncbi:MAG: IS21 family transposase [Terrimicrobiaceae bacterium]
MIAYESIVKDYVRSVRPVRHPAFLSLAFAPGEAAQVDWGCAGMIEMGNTRRRLSFFVMVLCHSRLAYVEFTCGECLEHFLACHQNALEFFGGTPAAVLIDNLKTGVLVHPFGERATFHPRYLDFAAHYGFEARACNVRKPNEKGRVENFVGYVKKNFLGGLDLPPGLVAMNTASRQWLFSIANARVHAETHKVPSEVFALEKPALRPLPPVAADTSVTRLVRVTNRCRIALDTNRYSVPAIYASQRLTLKVFGDRLCLYHAHNLVATHPRSYERHRDFENPDHVKDLLDQRRRARDAKWMLAFYSLSPHAEHYHQQLVARSLKARVHVNKILALSDIYGPDKVARAMEDAIASEAFSSQYIENILQQRERHTPQPGPLHLTRRSDLLDIELSPADLSLYDTL